MKITQWTNAWRKAILGLCAAAGLIGGWTSLTPRKPEIVSANRFELRDENGNIRGLWECGCAGVSALTILNDQGLLQLSLATGRHGEAGVAVFNSRGQRVAFVGASSEAGAAMEPGKVPSETKHSDRISVFLELFDGTGAKRVSIGIDESNKSKIALYDASAETIFSAP